MAGVIRDYQATGCDIKGAGLIVGSLANPESIANDHIRIHALRGSPVPWHRRRCRRLRRFPCAISRERDLYETASGILNQSEQALRVELAELASDRLWPVACRAEGGHSCGLAHTCWTSPGDEDE